MDRIVFTVITFIFLFSQEDYTQQSVRLDWKMHDVGKVRQFVSNIGCLWDAELGWNGWTGLIYCEFPPGSFEEHVGEGGGIWIGAIMHGDTAVSTTMSKGWWNSDQEFYSGAEPWDTIWVVHRADTVDIPYWPDYVGISDQDFVCRYSDYFVTNIANHMPLYLDIIQTSHAWSSYPLDEMLVFNFQVIPTRYDLQNVYIAYFLDGDVGCRSQGQVFANDDYSQYYPEHRMAVALDFPGKVDGLAFSPIGIKIIIPDTVEHYSLRWTFSYEGSRGGRDLDSYLQISEGVEMRSQIEPNSDPPGTAFLLCFGPFDILSGDTLRFSVGEILGEGIEGLLKNAERMNWLISNDFRTPAPPPPPPLRFTTSRHSVTLKWNALPGQKNPETYTDPYRADSAQVPFEGYRVYKSTISARGPWTLLAEFDLPDNNFGYNTGLDTQYTDLGLLNNFEYYYTVTAFSKPDLVTDFPSQESSQNDNARVVIPGPEPPARVGEVAVVPNPYRGDVAYHQFDPAWEPTPPSRNYWMEQDRKIQFINLPAQCEIKIYTLAGDMVRTLKHDSFSMSFEDWNLTSDVGQAISSGIYLFTVQDYRSEDVQTGKFVIIK